jgi:hypothetical protein
MRLFDDDADLKGRAMKIPALIATAVAGLVVAACASPTTAEARSYRHHHASCGYALHYDYSHGNSPEPGTYIYPSANWGPFFACTRHYGPVVYAVPTSY